MKTFDFVLAIFDYLGFLIKNQYLFIYLFFIYTGKYVVHMALCTVVWTNIDQDKRFRIEFAICEYCCE